MPCAYRGAAVHAQLYDLTPPRALPTLSVCFSKMGVMLYLPQRWGLGSVSALGPRVYSSLGPLGAPSEGPRTLYLFA